MRQVNLNQSLKANENYFIITFYGSSFLTKPYTVRRLFFEFQNAQKSAKRILDQHEILDLEPGDSRNNVQNIVLSRDNFEK